MGSFSIFEFYAKIRRSETVKLVTFLWLFETFQGFLEVFETIQDEMKWVKYFIPNARGNKTWNKTLCSILARAFGHIFQRKWVEKKVNSVPMGIESAHFWSFSLMGNFFQKTNRLVHIVHKISQKSLIWPFYPFSAVCLHFRQLFIYILSPLFTFFQLFVYFFVS